MNKTFYAYGIFFLGLTLACGIFQSILYLRLDNQIFIQQSFANWFLVTNIIGLAGSLLMLKYYHSRKYRFTFITAALVTTLTFCQFIVLYVIIVARELQNFYIPIAFLVLAAGIAYSTSLIFSDAGKRFWLKTAGVLILIISIILVSAGTGSMVSQDVSTKLTLQKILQWASVGYTLIPIFFILNFLSESRAKREDRETIKLSKLQEGFLSLLGLTGFVFAVFLGGMLSNQSNSFLSWQKQNFELGHDVLAKRYEARFFVNAKGDTMRYQFITPLDYDPQKKYPLVLCLHHGGTHGTDNFSQLGADPAPFLSSNINKYPAFYLMPQCPQGLGWANIDAAIFEIIQELEDEFEIDDQRRYVMGISGGGYGSWHFISARPEMFAAAIPICGGGNPKLASKIAHVPVWAFHGEKDNLVPVRLSREMIDGMKKAGGNPRYTEFPGAAHNIWGQVVTTPGLMDWLFAQKQEAAQPPGSEN
jgi:predicted esterase